MCLCARAASGVDVAEMEAAVPTLPPPSVLPTMRPCVYGPPSLLSAYADRLILTIPDAARQDSLAVVMREEGGRWAPAPGAFFPAAHYVPTPPSPSSRVFVITGLLPLTQVHVKVIASNAAGSTSGLESVGTCWEEFRFTLSLGSAGAGWQVAFLLSCHLVSHIVLPDFVFFPSPYGLVLCAPHTLSSPPGMCTLSSSASAEKERGVTEGRLEAERRLYACMEETRGVVSGLRAEYEEAGAAAAAAREREAAAVAALAVSEERAAAATHTAEARTEEVAALGATVAHLR